MYYLDRPKYLISDVARATDVPANTIRSWFARGHVALLETDEAAGANGMAHRLSLRSALRIGAMGALVAQGVDPKRAGIAALRWTDTGEAGRDPGELYREPLTILCAYADGHAVIRHSPLRTGLAFDLLISPAGRQDGVTVVPLDFVDRAVRSALGVQADAAS